MGYHEIARNRTLLRCNRKYGGRLNVQADTANGSALDSGINRLVPLSMVRMPSRPQYGRLMRIKAHKATALPLHRIPPAATAIAHNIGLFIMQTSHTTSSTAATASLGRRIVAASWKPALFAVLMWLSAAAGAIPIPGTPVPITLQTFVVMLAGSDAAVASGGFRRRRLPGSWCSRSPGVRGRRFHHALVGPSAASSSDSCLA